MTEAIAVEPRGRISPEDLGIWSSEHAEALRPITRFVKQQGRVPGIQLAHAGRKASIGRPWEGGRPLQPDEGGWTTIAPSAVPWPYDDPAPLLEAMTREDMTAVRDAFVDAAEHALDAGFEIAEVHAAHGYLLHEFLSPVTNQREDEFGGRFENRVRFPLEVIEAVRDVWPADKPVFVRISAKDYFEDRACWTVEQSTRLVEEFAEIGVDLVDVSSGAIDPTENRITGGPNYQLPFVEQIRQEMNVDIAVGTVGGITTPEQAEEIVRNDRADVVIVGREFLRNPYFGVEAAEALGEGLDVPVQYRRAMK